MSEYNHHQPAQEIGGTNNLQDSNVSSNGARPDAGSAPLSRAQIVAIVVGLAQLPLSARGATQALLNHITATLFESRETIQLALAVAREYTPEFSATFSEMLDTAVAAANAGRPPYPPTSTARVRRSGAIRRESRNAQNRVGEMGKKRKEGDGKEGDEDSDQGAGSAGMAGTA